MTWFSLFSWGSSALCLLATALNFYCGRRLTERVGIAFQDGWKSAAHIKFGTIGINGTDTDHDRLERIRWMIEQHMTGDGTFTDATEEMLYQVWRNRSGEEA